MESVLTNTEPQSKEDKLLEIFKKADQVESKREGIDAQLKELEVKKIEAKNKLDEILSEIRWLQENKLELLNHPVNHAAILVSEALQYEQGVRQEVNDELEKQKKLCTEADNRRQQADDLITKYQSLVDKLEMRK